MVGTQAMSTALIACKTALIANACLSPMRVTSHHSGTLSTAAVAIDKPLSVPKNSREYPSASIAKLKKSP